MSKTALLRLHGQAVSNYFDAAQAALIEKGVPFEVVDTRAAQTLEFLAMNPMGKIPVLETPHGHIAETIAILEYLEDAIPAPPLYPLDAFQRARARQINNIVQCYIEVPARTLYPGVFMGGTNSLAAIEAARPVIERGAKALSGLITLGPYLVGERCGNADLFTFYCLNLVERLTQHVYRWSILDGVAGLGEWFTRVADRESSRIVLDGFNSAFEAYLAAKGAAYRDPAHRLLSEAAP
jgi:glutathione S-transferase